jgi:hypothetical protein
MTGVIIAIWPIALLIAAAIVGIPLWMTLRHRRAAPDHRETLSHYRAKQATAAGQPISDFGPAEPAAAVDGLTIIRKTRTADDDDMAVPVQRHW